MVHNFFRQSKSNKGKFFCSVNEDHLHFRCEKDTCLKSLSRSLSLSILWRFEKEMYTKMRLFVCIYKLFQARSVSNKQTFKSNILLHQTSISGLLVNEALIIILIQLNCLATLSEGKVGSCSQDINKWLKSILIPK